MTDRPWLPLVVDFGRSRQLPDPDRYYQCSINTTKGILLYAMLNCYTAMLTDRCQPYAANFRLNPCRQRSVLYIEDAGGGGGRLSIKARRAQATLSVDRSESKRQHLSIDQAGSRISLHFHSLSC